MEEKKAAGAASLRDDSPVIIYTFVYLRDPDRFRTLLVDNALPFPFSQYFSVILLQTAISHFLFNATRLQETVSIMLVSLSSL